ncbi:MAG: diguanylate cyclase domain-containing protein [Candidatus Saccharibacteria bacterium]
MSVPAWNLKKIQEGFRTHDHVCVVFDSQQHMAPAVLPFLAAGLQRDERVILLSSNEFANQIAHMALEQNIDIHLARKDGQLIFADLIDLARRGKIDSEGLASLVINEALKAKEVGVNSIRVCHDMTAVMKVLKTNHALTEYESRLNRDLFAVFDCTGLCVCDESSLSSDVVKSAIHTHPLIMRGKRVYKNNYYIPPQELLDNKKDDFEVRRWLANIESTRAVGFSNMADADAIRIKETDSRYKAIVENQTDPICRYLQDGTLTYVNEACCRFFGKNRTELVNTNLYEWFAEGDQKLIRKSMSNLNANNSVISFEHCFRRFEGDVRWQQWTIRAITDEKGNFLEYQAIGRDVTQRKMVEDQLKFLSLHDPLTGLYNRVYFEEEMLRVANGRQNPLGLVVCDVDGLKLVNDSYGHEAGDGMLLAASNLIKECFREGDVIARVGGDEFAVLLLKTPETVVEEACRRIRNRINDYNKQNCDFPLSISVGYSVRHKAETPMVEVFKQADNNMHREKLHRSQSARSAIVQTLMKALEARDFITEGHTDRLQGLVEGMALVMGLSESHMIELKLLARFHDIGKVGLSDSILFKPGPLTGDEYQEMQRHCEIGHRIALSSPDLALIADGILKHHEWWNGNGYPLGLARDEIPLHCRILSIADAFDAITSDRPYRSALSRDEAIGELVKCSGTQFDPDLVPKFVEVVQTYLV